MYHATTTTNSYAVKKLLTGRPTLLIDKSSASLGLGMTDTGVDV
jgi:hypothetical protein